MNCKGLSNLEQYISEQQGKNGNIIDYFIVAEPELSKDEFLDAYYNFLMCEKAPIDILNSKIQTFDVLLVPIIIFKMTLKNKISVDIGDNRIIKDAVRVWDDYNHKYKTEYEETKVTDWHHEEFITNYEKYGVFCANNDFKSIIENSFNHQIDSIRFSSFTDVSPESYTKLNIDIPLKPPVEWVEAVHKENKDIITKEIGDKGDLSKNLNYTSDIESLLIIPIMLPVGYITYKYGSVMKYSYLRLLNNKEGKILQASIPETELQHDFHKTSGNLIVAYVGFWIVLFVIFWFLQNYFVAFELNNNNLLIGIIIIVTCIIMQLIDLYYVRKLESDAKKSYQSAYIGYKKHLFSIHVNKIKELLLSADKRYKGYNYDYIKL